MKKWVFCGCPIRLRPIALFYWKVSITCTRMNEIYLFSSPRPVRIVHRADGWTPEAIAQHAIPAMRAAFMPLDTSEQAFPWDPL